MHTDGLGWIWRWWRSDNVSWDFSTYSRVVEKEDINDLKRGFTYFFGGLLQLIASVLEFILGNTFPFVVFGSFGK